MTADQALVRVLAMPIDRPGVGRLACELLSEITGIPILTTAPPVERLPGTSQIGKTSNNPWGRSGRPSR